MTISQGSSLNVLRYSTNDVEPPRRFEYWTSVLSQALIPMTVTSDDTATFNAEIASASLGALQVVRSSGTAHDSRRVQRDVEHSRERSFHLLISTLLPWHFTHRGQNCLLPGDVVLNDSRVGHEINIRSDYNILNLKLPVEWVNTWLPDPDLLVGKVISSSSGFGRGLSYALRQLTPEYVADAPVPNAVLTDHIGAMLALVAGENQHPARSRVMRQQIFDCICQRYTETELTAVSVAESLDIELSELHRALAVTGQTFTSALMDVRINRATQLLRTREQKRGSVGNISREVGFRNSAHLTRTLRRSTRNSSC